MSSSFLARWPFKGPTAMAVAACASLWFLGQRAEDWTRRHGDTLGALGDGSEAVAGEIGTSPDAAELSAAMQEALGEELAAYGPLAGLAPGGSGPGDASEAEPEENARPPGWVYPDFDEPAEGLHGAPAAALPRNVRFALVGQGDEPLAPEKVRVFERHLAHGGGQQQDLESELSPYRVSDGGHEWSFGVRGLLTGRRAYFRVEVTLDGEPRSQTLVLDKLGTEIDIDAGPLRF